jgi:hypothetical protein
MKYWLLRVVGFVLGAGAAVALEAALLLLISVIFGREFMPRGAGWLFLPIALGISASAAAPNIWLRIQRGDFPAAQRFRSASLLVRGAIVFPVFWILCVGIYTYLFEPYGYMGDSDYIHMFKVMLFPPAVALVGVLLYKKLIAPGITEKPKE